MNELALFAGAGGGILGGKRLGWRTVCAVEYDEYARNVLISRQNDGSLEPFPILDDVRTFDGRPWRGVVDVVSGGFPCQDISVAGKGCGLDGARSGLWSEMARIVGEVRPRIVWVENSQMLVRRGLDRVLADLTEMGYDSRWGVVGADDAGALHRRKRIWILAHARHLSGGVISDDAIDEYVSNAKRESGHTRQLRLQDQVRDARLYPTQKCQDERAALTDRGKCNLGEVIHGNENILLDKRLNPDWVEWLMGWYIGWTDITKPCKCEPVDWSIDPGDDGSVPRVTTRREHRSKRIVCLGNGQVPQAMELAYTILSRSL